ncbi:radical SAM/SPASM domain-containing protein [Novosphingobium beihaiensis]|uniref:SPASM domain-containing protein n=1 Tax=Novosphingobium beihaiensis TaxID=2930389 RepID=A0ABT0BL66_9SPHN|nr:radical SAM/SPASM domain-containing protein [Novosphingobium beihaiensis]MCJ2185803.1 SPASM domain-containing protein [Novosphingobium beihaiensis]
MESIYYAMSWACHRKCRHCYETRFRPYVRGALDGVVAQAADNFPRVIDNLPRKMTYLDRNAPLPGGGYREKTGRIILAGGEVLLDPVREAVLYPAMERLQAKYGRGGIKIIVQTTGDLVTPQIIEDLLERGVWMISISGMDDFHVGMEGEKRLPLIARLEGWFAQAGINRSGWQADNSDNIAWSDEDGPLYHFFGATEDEWIGKLWPRGRAWENSLSTAGMEDNFCADWAGARNFLDHRHSGSEVSVDPSGDVFPCCAKTKLPVGNLTEEPLTEILDSLAGHPVYQALSEGRPDRMGLEFGWDEARFAEACQTVTPAGKAYSNPCIGCDRFHEEVMVREITRLRQQRRARRMACKAA